MKTPFKKTLPALALACAGLVASTLAQAETTPKIERVNSSTAHVIRAESHAIEAGIKVSGSLRKRPSGRGAIPGHLHIEAFGANGSLLGETRASAHRRNSQAKESHFDGQLPVAAGQVEKVRITHHGLGDKC